MNILIVDDNDTNLYMLQSLLEGNGYEVFTASDGKVALQVLESEDIELIVSDILMPVMDGFSLCREVRKSEKLKHIPFIVYTATYTGPQDEALAVEIGADRFIVKPCDPDLLIKSIEEVLDNTHSTNRQVRTGNMAEESILKLYNERLVRKLEQKMLLAEEEAHARKEAIAALHRNEALLNATQSISKIGGWEWDVVNNEMFWTKETYNIHDLDEQLPQEKSKQYIDISVDCYEEADKARILKAFNDCQNKGIPYELECNFTSFKGRKLIVRTSGKAVYENHKIVKVYGYIQDVTETRKAEQEQLELREQLRQSQKLDSIGQLAGGIAHDLNNILTVILGYGEEIRYSLLPEDTLYSDVNEILKAGQRALNLTRQLLTFSRKHVIQPQIVDINTVVTDLSKMLTRLIGEDVNLSLKLAGNLGKVKADIVQIEQIIMNLVINSREAMPIGGSLILETANVKIDGKPTDNHLGLAFGDYVLLTVKDSGCGMDKDTASRVFEPFFTTKHTSKGTGLGLSTVYGIVTQSNGAISLDSEPGKGTTFRIYLPQTHEQSDTTMAADGNLELSGHGEHIVIVEDDAPINTLIKKMIEKLGYLVTTFENAEDAIFNIVNRGLIPDLVITDVVMTGMNGKEMADKLRQTLPELKVLFMSGYTDSIIMNHGVLYPDIPFIQKPFTREEIGLHVKHLLQAAGKQDHHGLNVLIIDDDESIVQLYKRYLDKRGHQVTGVDNLKDALKELSLRSFNVILVDLNIPGTDGLYIIRSIRDAGYTMPAIVLSGNVYNIDNQSFEPLGVLCALEKSGDMQQLLTELNKLPANKKAFP